MEAAITMPITRGQVHTFVTRFISCVGNHRRDRRTKSPLPGNAILNA
jgi:hypothetical protein